MAKELIFGGKTKDELLEKRKAFLARQQERAKGQALRPLKLELDVECPECKHAFKHSHTHELQPIPERPEPTLEQICVAVVAYLTEPIINYRPQRRTAVENVKVFSITDKLRGFEDPEKAFVVLEDADYDFLKKCWTEYGDEKSTDFDWEETNPMTRAREKRKSGWVQLLPQDQPVWTEAWNIINGAAEKIIG